MQRERRGGKSATSVMLCEMFIIHLSFLLFLMKAFLPKYWVLVFQSKFLVLISYCLFFSPFFPLSIFFFCVCVCVKLHHMPSYNSTIVHQILNKAEKALFNYQLCASAMVFFFFTSCLKCFAKLPSVQA